MAVIQDRLKQVKRKSRSKERNTEGGITLTFKLIDAFYEKWMETDILTTSGNLDLKNKKRQEGVGGGR